jgi:hypothetical protein
VTAVDPRPAGPVALLDRITGPAGEHGVAVNALGGVGVALRAGPLPPALQRAHGDLDIVVRRGERRGVEAALADAGLVPDELFNRMNGHRRQVWWTPEGDEHVDVFLGRFEMCHALDLEDRVDGTHRALPATDLLLTKLQVVELNAKDVRDAGALLRCLDLAADDDPGVLSARRLEDVLGADWGFFTTVQDNLARLPDDLAALAGDEVAAVRAAAERLSAVLEASPKTRGWRMRARIGRRKRWYTLPDESLDDATGHA